VIFGVAVYRFEDSHLARQAVAPVYGLERQRMVVSALFGDEKRTFALCFT
jgi:hypothetical protein